MRVLAVGTATVDLIARVERYPVEDTEVRATALRTTRGGNACNTLVALTQLGHRCAWAGSLAEAPESAPILADLDAHTIDRAAAWPQPGRHPPTSLVLIAAGGSRTIVHHRDLDEYPAAAFAGIDLAPFDWIHFEGRAVAECRAMLDRVAARRPRPCVSLELEKPRPGIDALFDGPDLLLGARGFAMAQGFDRPGPFLDWLLARSSARWCVCAWGADGAEALARDGERVALPAAPPAQVVDTLGAGDVFNAGIIDGLGRGLALADAVAGAIALAGRKCGIEGLDGIADGTA